MAVVQNIRCSTTAENVLVRALRLGVSVTGLMLAGTALAPASAQQRDLDGVLVTINTMPFTEVTNGTLHVVPAAGGITYGGALTDSLGQLGLIKSGINSLTLTGSGLNTYSGDTVISGNLLIAGAANVLSPNSWLNISNQGVDLAGFDQTVRGLSGRGTLLNTGGAAILTINTSVDRSFSGVISGNTKIVKNGNSVQTFGGANTYTGGTVLNGGGLRYSNNLSFGTGAITVSGASTLAPAIRGRVISNAIILDAALNFQSGGSSTELAGEISGAGQLTKSDYGNLALSNGANTYTGGTVLAKGGIRAVSGSLGSGTISVTAGTATFGSIGGVSAEFANDFNLAGNLNFELPTAADKAVTLSGKISGGGALYLKTGAGSLILTQANNYTGGTLIGSGTLGLGTGTSAGTGRISAGGATSTIAFYDNMAVANQILTGSSLAFDTRGFQVSLNGQISNKNSITIGGINKVGAGSLTLAGINTYTGATKVAAGVLNINGSIKSNVSVASGATLGGTGIVAAANSVTVNDGGIIAPGVGITAGTLTVGNLSLGAGSLLNFDLKILGAVGGDSDLIIVTNNLTLDGTLNVNALTGFGTGTYRLINYGGVLINNGLLAGTAPTDFSYLIDTATSGQVDLLISFNGTRYWDASVSIGDGTVDGGTGTWVAGAIKWTNAAGVAQVSWDSTVGVFAGLPGIVTVSGTQAFTNLSFTTAGYRLTGGALATNYSTLDLANSGTTTIDSTIIGTNGLTKTGAGTLVLGGDNTYTGGTNLDAGAIVVSNNAALGIGTLAMADGTTLVVGAGGLTLANAIALTGTDTIDSGGSDFTLVGIISGSGGFNKVGGGTLNLTETSTYTGATNVNSGTLNVTGSLGDTTTTVASGASLTGTGSIAGSVTILDGGTIAPGSGGVGTLTLGTLTLNNSSNVNFDLGAANWMVSAFNDRIIVSGDLVLDGLLTVAQSADGSFTRGIYNLFQYDGLLTDNGFVIDPLPFGRTGTIQTTIAGQVNLVVSASPVLLYWDGADGIGNGVISGGGGVWHSTSTNWTGSAPSEINANWVANGVAVFQTVGGTVNLIDSLAFSGLQFAADGYLLTASGAGALTTETSSFISVDGGNTATITAPINGAGEIVKQGAGLLRLGGDNGYQGGTQLTAGQIEVLSNTALGTGTLAMAGDTVLAAGVSGLVLANVITTAGNGRVNGGAGVFTLNGNITGAGSLSSIGSGNLVLNGNNGFTNLGINTGTVTVGTNTAAGIGSIAMANNTVLAADVSGLVLANVITTAGNSTVDTAAYIFTLDGQISGAGSLTKIGSGILNLMKPNLYSGGTVINAGTVGIATSTSLSSGTLTINSGTLLANANGLSVANLINFGGAGAIDTAANTLNVSGVIGGSGRITKLGTGTLSLTGANSFTGGMTISAGTVTGAASNYGSGGILNNAALIFNEAADGSFSQVISGTGTVSKIGAGALTIASINTLTGPTTVTAGRLNVTGSLGSSAVTVQTGAALSGSGTVGPLVAQSGSVITPGSTAGAIATLAVNGAFTLAAGATLAVDVSPTLGGDRVAATGVASLAGNLVVTPAAGLYTTFFQSYTLVSGSALSGTFATSALGSFGAPFVPVLVYNATSVTLRLAPNSLVTLGGAGLGGNALAVAGAFDTAVASGYNPQPFFNLYTQGTNLPTALSQLSGELHSAERRVALDDTRVVREAAFDRLNAGLSAIAGSQSVTTENAGKATTFWLRGAGSWGTAKADGIGSRFTTEQRGFLTGIDFASNGYTLGGLFHFTSTDVDLASLGKSKVESVGGAIYAGYRQENSGLAIGAGGSLASTKFDGSRSITAPGLTQSLTSRADAATYQVFGEVAYDLASAENIRAEPYFRVAYARVDSNSMNEAGGSAAVFAGKQNNSLTMTTVGLRGAYNIGKTTLSGSAGWQRATGDRAFSTFVAITGVNKPYTVRSVAVDRDAVALEAQASFNLSSKVRLGAGYSGVIGSKNTDHGARATLTVGF